MTRGGRRAEDYCLDFARRGDWRILLAAIAALAIGCGGSSSNAPTVPAGPITVTGAEHLAWNQSSIDGRVGSYQYRAYVDDAPQKLDASCQASSDGAQAQCLAPLPKMNAGTHRLELATVVKSFGIERESPRSAPLLVLVTGSSSSTSSTAASAGSRVRRTASDGTSFVVETLAADLDRPSAIAPLADGRVLVAEASGNVRVWQDGALLSEPALTLSDAVDTGDAGSIDLAPHPRFADNHEIFVVYTARANGEFTSRVIRFREANNVLGEAAVLLEDRTTTPPARSPRIRFGPDGKLYVALPAGGRAEADDPARYQGKILRLNEDGTTPRDNPGYSPIVSSGHFAPGAFDWQPGTGRLWLGERAWDGRDVLEPGASPTRVSYVFDPVVDPSAAMFYGGHSITGFDGDLLIAALDGRHIQRVRFDPQDPTRVTATERLVDGDFGRISDIAAGADGAIYFCTSNVRSSSASAGDRLLRLLPSAVAATNGSRIRVK